MVYDFKIRNGVRTCDPCGRDEQYAKGKNPVGMECVDANCPFKNRNITETAEELAERYARFDYWRV